MKKIGLFRNGRGSNTSIRHKRRFSKNKNKKSDENVNPKTPGRT